MRLSAVPLLCCLLCSTFSAHNFAWANDTKPHIPKIANKLFALKLNEAIEIGFQTNPEYASALNAEKASKEVLKQAHALYKPTIDINADTGYESTDDQGTRARSTNGTETLYRYETGLTVTQRIFDGFEGLSEIDRGYYASQAAKHNLHQTAQNVALNITQAYLNVIQQRKRVQISNENIDAHLNIVKQIKDNVDAGRSTEADEQQARARLARAEALKANIESDLKAAEARFTQEVGMYPPQLATFTSPKREILDDIEKEIAEALITSPEIKSYEARSKAAEAAIDSARSDYYPHVDLQLNARQGEDLGGLPGKDSSASALFTMNWNLYRGGADIARTQESIFRSEQSKNELLYIQRDIEQRVRSTWAQMIAAQKQAKAYNRQIEANKKIVNAYWDQFSLKRRTLLDVLNAQNELFTSRQSALDAEFQERISIYNLLALKGKLLDALNIDFKYQAFAEKQ